MNVAAETVTADRVLPGPASGLGHPSPPRLAAGSPELLAMLGRALLAVLCTSVYASTLHWVYAHLVTEQFAYAGFTYVPASTQATVVTVISACVVAVTLPTRLTKVSHVVLCVLFVVCVAPAMLMVAYTGYVEAGAAVAASLLIGASFSIATTGTRLLDGRTAPTSAPPTLPPGASSPADRARRRLSPESVMWAVVALHSLATYGLMAATTGITLRFVALDDVYDVRAVYKDAVQGDNGLLGYFLSGQANVINTLVMARGLTRRNWAFVALGVASQFVLYSGTGFKTILFSFPAVLLIALATRRRPGRRVVSSWPFLIGPVVLMAVAATVDEAQDGFLWTSLFARRFLITPGMLTSVYVDFFEQNPPAMLGHSVLRWWFDYPYERSIPLEVGQFLQPGGALAANANLFADGFANFGAAGVVGAGALLLAFLRFVDRTSRGLPLAVAAMVMIMPSITLSNTSLLTAMLSHGLAIGTIVLAVAPRTGWHPPAHGPERRRT
ncbi:hypothetical protein [uncultured Frigoribacterium sp.]|uniref:hypothetical protein n=1 Tax=uncultured Frigoribacterium sp. TaxID=335377 RepID=UPI0028D13D93|nr:hypothetical protein [uncultured Frigoribacterium sp.]